MAGARQALDPPALRPVGALLVLLGSLAPALGCRCGDEATRRADARLAAPDLEDPADRPSSLVLPAREPGPPRPEGRAAVEAARREARELVRTLRASGVSGREAAAMADIRGYRLYRRRYFQRARVWFEAAVDADATFEPALYNAARVAALLGDRRRARSLIERLAAVGTPLARSRLQLAQRDPELAPALSGSANRPARGGSAGATERR